VHLTDGLGGVGTLGSLARQHDAVSTVSDSVSNVADLSTSRTRVLDHRLKHLGGADNGLASKVAHGNELLLSSKDLGGGNLDTQVTTGNHDTVSLAQNLGEVVETLTVLNLGNDLNLLALLAQNGTDVLDILGTSDERGKDHVDLVLDTKFQVVLVLLGEGRQVNVSVGQVDTLLGGDEAVVAGAGLDVLVVLDGEDVESENTVVNVDDSAGLDDLCDVLVVDIPR
jgi:hypothetical protein